MTARMGRYRQSESVTHGPANFESPCDHGCGESGVTCPVLQDQAPSVMFDAPVTATIALLHSLCRPSAVINRVWSVVVDAVQRVTDRWPWSHIQQKSGEVITPLSAHVDATASVAWEVLASGVVAASLSARPCPVFDGAALAVRQVFRRGNLSAQTSTTARMSNLDSPRTDDFHATAIAPAQKSPLPISGSRCIGLNREAAVSGSDSWNHNGYFTTEYARLIPFAK